MVDVQHGAEENQYGQFVQTLGLSYGYGTKYEYFKFFSYTWFVSEIKKELL